MGFAENGGDQDLGEGAGEDNRKHEDRFLRRGEGREEKSAHSLQGEGAL